MNSKPGNSPIVQILVYFNIFHHPLKLEEILHSQNLDQISIKQQIDPFLKSQTLFEYNGYYSPSSSIKNLVAERVKKEERAKSYFTKLPFYTRIIKSFPFVKGIAISGSLSKGVMHEDGDIDYFIVTSKNRLWICRTFLILFKKIFLFNSRKYFCLNYFVDEENLKIKDENIFTAIEVNHLLPVYNSDLIAELKKKNDWTKHYFKGTTSQLKLNPTSGDSKSKLLIEKALNYSFAEKLDLYFMRLTCKRWQSKFKGFDEKKMELTMRSNRGVSKHHPSDFQTKVLTAYSESLQQLNLKNESLINA